MQNKTSKILITGAIACMLAVAFGAFGAHGLRELLEENGASQTYRTAVLYHLVHALGILILGLIHDKYQNVWIYRSYLLLLVGIILFSGSLYLISVARWTMLGPVTPIGGVCFIGGWLFLVAGIKKAGRFTGS